MTLEFQTESDREVKEKNPFMPLTGEILLIGVKATFKEIKILENYGRDEVNVVTCPGADQDEYQEVIDDARDMADHWPMPHVVICDIFSATHYGAPIAPDSRNTVFLSVSHETGELDILASQWVGFTGSNHDFLKEISKRYQGYDYYFVAKVIGHGWPK